MTDTLDPMFRDLCEVKRWAIVYTSRQQSVAEHSFNVTLLVMGLCKNLGIDFNGDLAALCVMHDMNEIHTGDIPSPAKRSMAITDPYYRHYSSQVTKDELALVKVADLLEAVLFMIEEKKHGNYKTAVILNELVLRLRTACLDYHNGKALLILVDDTMDRAYRYDGRTR